MFGFFKKDDGSTIVKERVRYICDLNIFAGQTVTLRFLDDRIRLEFEEDEREIEYSRIVSCGKIKNVKSDIRRAMDENILSQAVLSSSGFAAGEFFTVTSQAKEFLFFKFQDSKNEKVIHTFLAVYNEGINKAIDLIRRKAGKK